MFESNVMLVQLCLDPSNHLLQLSDSIQVGWLLRLCRGRWSLMLLLRWQVCMGGWGQP